MYVWGRLYVVVSHIRHPEQNRSQLMAPTPTQRRLKSSWKMWERPLFYKTSLRLPEVEPRHSYSPQWIFAQAYLTHPHTLNDPLKIIVTATLHLHRTARRRSPFKRRTADRKCQLPPVSKGQSMLISTESPSYQKHLLKKRMLRERRGKSGPETGRREELKKKGSETITLHASSLSGKGKTESSLDGKC